MRTSSRSVLSKRSPSWLRTGTRGYATTTTHPGGPKNHHPTTTAAAAAAAPPPPRPFKPLAAHERVARYPDYPLDDSAASTEKKGGGGKGIFSRLWPFASSSTSSTSPQPEPIYPASPDPQRGLEAVRRVVTEGVLDPRYQRAARKYTMIMCALPIAIYTSYELFQRRFRGKQQKGRPEVQAAAAAAEEEVVVVVGREGDGGK